MPAMTQDRGMGTTLKTRTCRPGKLSALARPMSPGAPALVALLIAATACQGSSLSSHAASASPAQGVSRPGTARWYQGSRLPLAVSEVGVALLGGEVHVLGGYVAGRPHSRTHLVLNLATGRWRTAAPLPVALDHVAAVAVGSGPSVRLLAMGGYGSAGRPTDGVYSYDPADDRWTARARLAVPRAAGVAVLAGGLVHYIGGKSAAGDTGEHDVYDPTRNRWSTAPPMPTPRDHAAAAVLADTIWVAGGRPGAMTTLEGFDLRAGKWITGLPGLPLGRSSLAAAAWRGLFVVVGGESAGERTAYRNVDGFDPGARRWRSLPELPGPRQGIGAVVDGQTLLVPGGGPAAGAAEQTDTLLELR